MYQLVLQHHLLFNRNDSVITMSGSSEDMSVSVKMNGLGHHVITLTVKDFQSKMKNMSNGEKLQCAQFGELHILQRKWQ